MINVQVQFICMQFDLFFYGSIDICGSSIYMYAVLFIFGCFDIKWTSFALFVRV